MASNYPLYKITYTFAQNGNKKIPPATASAAGTGRFSQAKGFDQINSKPLNQGGIPPYREDFNGAFYLLSSFLRWYQQGGIMKYDATLDYELDNEIYYNGNKYRCIQANGASTTVKAPTDSAYWQNITFVGSTVLYVPQTLDVSQQNQARANINAMSITGFSQTAISQVAEDTDKLRFMTPNNTLKATVYKSQFPNLFNHLAPTVQTVLWSGDSDNTDLSLSVSINNFDALMFIFGTNDHSPSTGGEWRYSVIPVWVLRKIITDHDFFGLSEDYFNLCQDDLHWWFIDVANSTTTLLKHHADYTVHMWRVVGLRFTTTVTPENG